MELENWVNSIHSACAAAFARHRGKTGTLHLLQEEIIRLEKAIESVCGGCIIPGVILTNHQFHLPADEAEYSANFLGVPSVETDGETAKIHSRLREHTKRDKIFEKEKVFIYRCI